jgi:thiamine kinase-like enzyme
LFDQIPLLARSPRTIEELPGGLTNRNYKVATPAGTFVARVALPGTELLAIDRDTEYRNSVTAAASGAGAPVLGYYPEHGVLVLGYLEGRTLTSKDVADPALIPRIAAACRRLHSGGRFGNEFNMFAVQARYAEIARSRGFAIPAGYHDYAGQFQAARAALEASATGTVPCNNDLLAANLILNPPTKLGVLRRGKVKGAL